jgi:exopolysaccharide production protein ExoZ
MGRQILYTLQSLRGIAALLVLLHHTTFLIKEAFNLQYIGGIFYQTGEYGVDFFFVLSGFIIFYSHYKDLGSKRLATYFNKRFTRVYPIYWIVTLPIIPMLYLFPNLGAQGTETQVSVILKSIFLFPNETPPILGVAWTLTHEVFFYLAFGLIFILLKPKYSIPVAITWLSITLASFSNLLSIENYFLLDFVFSKFNLEFILGMICAYLVIKNKIFYPKIMLLSGTFLFILSGINVKLMFFPIDRVISFGIPAFILVLGAASLDISSKIRIPKMLLFLGDASYSIYLTHYPVTLIIAKVFTILGLSNALHPFILMNLIALLTLASGCLFYIMIEKPLLNLIKTKNKTKSHTSNQAA